MLQNFHSRLRSRPSPDYGNRLLAIRRVVRVRHYVLMLFICCFLQEIFAAETRQWFFFELPAQNLQDALEQYSVIAGRELLYDSKIVEGKRSAALTGKWQSDDALRTLLQGSGVQAKNVGENAFTLMKANPGDPVASIQSEAPGTAPSAMKIQYYRRLQSSFTRLLCQDAVLKKNVFRAALQFWFGRDGSLERVRLLNSSGNASFDKRLIFQSQKLSVNSTPPDNVHQPLTVVIDPRTPLVCKNSR